MFIKMSESNRNESYVKPNSEFSRSFRWDSRSLGQGVNKEDGQSLAKGQEMGPLATKLDAAEISGEIIYYGVSIPTDANVNGCDEALHVYSDKVEALKVVKKHKKARFKAFKTRQEAVDFAVHGSEILVVNSPGSLENAESVSPIVGEKPSPFKGPKAQDLVRLRKVIECGDIDTFRITVWDNPRYLISSGDTPAILQEGSRYNALHVAAKARNGEICDLVLQTVSNVAFIQLLYGDDDTAGCQDRARILLDLYLNTPDKALNETPLHFAVKFGALAVADILVSYPQCDKHARNKFGQTPKDVICSRVSTPDAGLKRELSNLLDERFYVPVLRSEDNSMQPTIGEPFSPACPLVLKADPINPRMEIRAYAGPMHREQAVVFRRKWRTPPRVPRTSTQTPGKNSFRESTPPPPLPHIFRLQDTEKGLERVGRNLAQEFRVGWNEYWPFLDTFTNLASEEGLCKLEAYLKKRYMEAEQHPGQEIISNSGCERNGGTNVAVNGCASVPTECGDSRSSGDEAVSPMTDLCLAFKACSLSDENPGKPLVQNEKKATSNVYNNQGGNGNNIGMEDEALLNVLLNPGLSPFLYVEKSCQVFAKRISDGLSVVGRSARVGDAVPEMLRPEIRHLQDLVNSFKDDARFISVDFNLVHSRIAAIVASKLRDLTSDELDYVLSGLRSVILPSKTVESYSDEEDNVSMSYRNTQTFADHRRKTNCEHSQVKCIAEHILSALENEQSDKETLKIDGAKRESRIQTEEECMRIWSDALKCSCLRQTQNFTRNTRRGSSFKRSHNMRYMPPKGKIVSAENSASLLDSISRRLSFGAENEVGKSVELRNESPSMQDEHQLSGSDDTSDDDEDFTTPPSTPEKCSRNISPSLSEDDDDCDDDYVNMSTPDEGPDVFVQGDTPSKLDASVIQAIEGSNITSVEYPYIYRWRHSVLLYSERERACWPTPAQSRPKSQSRTPGTPESTSYQRRAQPSTPPQAWHKITGPYSPASPQRFDDYRNAF
ncbi:ankyrin repeat and LEM domain-containing protein 2 homolog isoform X2 [Periplaneta americana]|uniref:ankyrin repeat and LEM domain-containing protein 2 homolog isoform X2 n=1 Tax=Periplaneta americana TaxID=6978 RepID=UPI0037E8997D